MHPPLVVDHPQALGGEQRLVERARRGDLHAFDTLVAGRLASTFRLAKAIVGDADADDVTQDAFVQAWRTLPQLRESDRFDAWFGRVVVNTARMHLRKRGRVMTVAVDALAPDGEESARLGRPDASLDGVAASDALQRAIDRLTADQRTILALHHLEERSVAEVAAILGIPVGTAKWRLHDARQALQRAMETQR